MDHFIYDPKKSCHGMLTLNVRERWLQSGGCGRAIGSGRARPMRSNASRHFGSRRTSHRVAQPVMWGPNNCSESATCK